jgi:pilus assembly protein CpaB
MLSQQKGILILAVVMGVVAIILVNTYATRVREESEAAKGEMTAVLTLTRDVEQGESLADEMLKESQVPKKWRNPNALGPEDKELVLGARISVPLKAEQQLTWSDIGRTEEGLIKLSDAIKPGERAITIPVDANSGLSGLLHPNDHVDVIATFTVPGELDSGFEVSDARAQAAKKLGVEVPHYLLKTVTVTLLQNVTILATGRITGADDTPAAQIQDPQRRDQARYQQVTLLVTPREAEILAYTIRKGEVTLSLRSPEDLEVIEDFGKVVFTDLVEPEERKAVQQQHNTIQKKRLELLPERPKTEVIYGTGTKNP